MSAMSLTQTCPGTNSKLDDYELLSKCGEGTYGCVYKAIHKETRQLVALKKVANVPKEEGAPVEIKYLSMLLAQPNIVSLIDYFWGPEQHLCLVFEYMEYDLWKLMTGPQVSFTMLQIKCLMKQMLEGLAQCHRYGIMHRDIKPSNLLINAEGTLKLADFGLTTTYKNPNKLSHNVVSLYYRPPELLLGSHVYGPEIDMWSVGCIMIELITNNYLFAGANETEQLDLIFRVFGTPTEVSWPDVVYLPGWSAASVRRRYPCLDLPSLFNFLDQETYDLATRMLCMDPKRRITVDEALQHSWFWTPPLPCSPSRLPGQWNITTTTTSRSPRKYQSDFPRSRQLYKDMDAKKPPAKVGRPRGRKATTTKKQTTTYSPYSKRATTNTNNTTNITITTTTTTTTTFVTSHNDLLGTSHCPIVIGS